MFNTTLYKSVTPILILTAICGLSSILPIRNKTTKLRIYTTLKVINVFYIAAFTLLLYFACNEVLTKKLKPSYATGVAKIGIIFSLISQTIVTYVIYIINITQSYRVMRCLDDLGQIDKHFKELGELPNHKKHLIYEGLVLGAGIIVIGGRTVLVYDNTTKTIMQDTPTYSYIFLYLPFVSLLCENNFVFIVNLIHERFSLVNKLLKNFFHEKSVKNFKHDVKKIEILMEIHDFLTDIGNNLNIGFSLQIVTCFAGLFLDTVFSVFYFYYESLILKRHEPAATWLMWIVSTSMQIMYITATCHLTCREAKGVGVAIHKILIIETDPYIKRRLMIFSQQVLHRPLLFTGCGLFPIDTSFIFTIVGAAATYLLIMLQFQEGVEAQCTYNTYH